MNSDQSGKDNKSGVKMDSFELVIRNLKILANIKPSDKLVKHGDTIKIDTHYLYQGLSRYWNGNSRKESLNHIESLIEDSFNMIDLIYGNEIESRTGLHNYYNQSSRQYFETENSQKLTIFSTELQNVLKGLNHLKQTYHSDISICSRIDVVIEKINLRIKKIQELFHINVNNGINNSISIQNNTIHVEDIQDDLQDNFQFSDNESDD
jgi:ribonuclease HI